MPYCRIWLAKRICKRPWKNVYYLHRGLSWGSLQFFDASIFLIFILFYFLPLHFLWFLIQSNFNPSFFWKYAPRPGRKHNSRDRHTPTWTLKIACSARSYALLKASWHRFSDFDPPSRQGLIAKNNSKLCTIFTLFLFAACFGSLGRQIFHFFVDGHYIFKIFPYCLQVLLYFHATWNQILEHMPPAFAGEHYFANRPKGIFLQKLLFGTCPTLLATTKSPLALSKKKKIKQKPVVF